MAGQVVDANRENFRDLVAEGVVLVDVWGPQCRPCLALNPHVERFAEHNQDIRVVKLEAPKARRLCMELKLMGLPVFLLFKDGEEIARLSDPNLTPAALDEWLKAKLEPLRKEVS